MIAGWRLDINSTSYTSIKAINFAPESDITGSSVPINRFTVEIVTAAALEGAVGANALLYDRTGKLWGKYWIIDVEKVDANLVRVEAQSVLMLLDRITLPAVMYNGASAANVIDGIFSGVSAIYGGAVYSLDSSFEQETLTGYCPEQTARERLQWVCFVMGAYLKTFFSQLAEILPVSDDAEIIPESKTFWKPSVSYGDHVTAVTATSYSYVQGTPQATDEWVEVGGAYYIQSTQKTSLTNPDAPVTANTNDIEIDGCTLINASNVASILSRLSTYYFNRMEVSADVINNGEYEPGKKYVVCTGDRLITGFARTCSFKFGHQARATLKLMQSEPTESGNLIIEYSYGSRVVGSKAYMLPSGYVYSIENPHIDSSMDSHRYIFYPENEYATGTVGNDETVDVQPVHVAIDYHKRKAAIISVDELEYDDSSNVLRLS